MSLKTRQSQTLSGDSAYPFDLVTKERIYHLVAESHQCVLVLANSKPFVRCWGSLHALGKLLHSRRELIQLSVVV